MEEPSPLDFLRALRRAHKAVEDRIVEDLHRAGYSELRRGHLTILRHLDLESERRTTDLARAADISRQAVSQLVADLEELGILEQIPDPADGRARIVRYTRAGRERFACGAESFEAIRDELDGRLRSETIDDLLHDLDLVRRVASTARATERETR